MVHSTSAIIILYIVEVVRLKARCRVAQFIAGMIALSLSQIFSSRRALGHCVT